MAKLAIGPAGREALKIEIGAGNGQQRTGNAPGNNTPVGPQRQAQANDAEAPERNGRTQNDDGQVGFGDEHVGRRGDDGDDRGRSRGRGDGDGDDHGWRGHGREDGDDRGRSRGRGREDGDNDGDGLWGGWRTRGDHGGGRDRGSGKGGRLDVHWPIYTQTFPGRTTSSGTDDPEVNNRRDDERNRHWQESYSANQANLRRGVIRDYLRQNLQNTLAEARGETNLPIDLQRLTRTVAEELSRTFNDPAIVDTRTTLNLITKEISHLLDRDFNFRTNNNPTVIPYDRGIQIANQLVRYISNDVATASLRMTDRKMLDALILLQLCCNPGKYLKEMREITGHKPCILPEGIPWSAFRDTGLLAANLMREGASIRSSAQVEAAVQKFFKMIVANNELGILLAALRLASDARIGAVPNGSLIALVRIYELLAQLMIVTERLMREAAEAAARKPAELTKMDRGLAFAGALESSEAESALRQYLAFNPAAQSDSGACAFFSEGLAENSARIAVDSSQREIVEWLNSGRHRFVTEVDLGKAVGIVIDRASDECFTASQIRVVLVRDGSVLGWHILRSSLVA